MVRILHVLPGRLRFEALKGRPDLASRLHWRLERVDRIRRVEVDTRTGSVLLIYDPEIVTSPGFRAAPGQPLPLLRPKLDVRKLLSRLGLGD